MEQINFKDCCRFCLELGSFEKVEIDETIRRKFKEISNLELVNSEEYSNNCCQKCVENIETCLSIRSYLIENQNLLSDQLKLIKTESIEKEDNPEISDNPHNQSIFGTSDDLDILKVTIKEEPSVDLLLKTKSSKPNKRNKKHRKKFKVDSEDSEIMPNRVACPDCGKIIHPRNLLKHQKNLHLKEKDYTCDVCGRQFFKKYAVLCHLRVHFGIKVAACDICGMGFASSGTLLAHKNLVHVKKYLQYCHICGKSFNCKKYFDTHMRAKHSFERPFICNYDECGKTFSSNYSLKIHQKQTHSTEFFNCPVCNKVLKSKMCLRIHMKYHEEPKFECDTVNPETNQLCGRKFVTSTLLKEHINIFHRGIKKHQCPHCENSFSGKSDLKYHVINVHEMRKIKCELCQGTFGSRAYYTRHINQNHRELADSVREAILEKIRKANIEDLFNYRKT